jgi:transglutaminase-like putative cysteine protease
MRFAVTHRTEYRYGASMLDGYTLAYVLPRSTPTQSVVSAVIEVDPASDEFEEHADLFGNRVARLGVHRPHDHLVVTARSVVDVSPPRNDLPTDDDVGESWETVAEAAALLRGERALDVGPFVAHTPATALDEATARRVVELVDGVFTPGRSLVGVVRALTARLHTSFEFSPGSTDVSTPISVVLDERRGVCQDFAHVMLAALRHHGLPTRYVSGYLETLPPPGQPRLIGADASHAWCSVWSPRHGWIDADPTNDQFPPERHVTVAWGRDYADVTPVRGVVIGPAAHQSLDVSVDVARLDT